MAEIVTMPKLGFDMAEGTLVRWVVLEGETVAKGAILAEIETDKATVEVESTVAGVVARHLVKEGDIVPVNTPIAVVVAPGEQVDEKALGVEQAGAPDVVESKQPEPESTAVASSVPAPAATPDLDEFPGGVKASPLARRVADELGVELKNVRGTGPGGRITRKDVEAQPSATPSIVAKPAEAPVAATLPVQAAQPDTIVPVNRLRAAIGRRMTEAKQQVPHFYVTYDYDMAAVMELRKQVNAILPEGEKTSVNDYLVKAVALALREYPNLNASLQGDEIIRHGQVNVGVAVAVEGGLLTVVCRDTDLKPIRLISSEVRGMAARAREGKVRPSDIEGSTFSVSNLGMFDVENFLAIINPPEAAILAVGSVREAAVSQQGQVVPGLRMKATISVDHRVSDGAEAARFLQSLARYFQEPLRLMV